VRIKLLHTFAVSTLLIVNFGFGSAQAATCVHDANGNLTVASGGSCTDYSLNNSSATGGLVNNSGSISASSTDIGLEVKSGALNRVNNYGTITTATGSLGAVTVWDAHIAGNAGAINYLYNSGTISATGGTANGIATGYDTGNAGSNIGTLENTGTISSSVNSGISNGATITKLLNSGTIVATNGNGIYNGNTITSIINYGTITGASFSTAISNDGSSSYIGTLTNLGTINISNPVAGDAAIYNNGGTIVTFNNSQGSGNANGAVTYGGAMPTNYNIIIKSATNYGQLYTDSNIGGVTGSTKFGIYSGSLVTTKLYTNVFQGIDTTNISSTRSGTYQGLTWVLGAGTGANNWDLTFTGTNTSVMSSLNQTASALQNVFTLQNSVLVNGFTYDCPVFDKNNVCVSLGGRYSTANTESVNSTGGLLIGAYRLNNKVRMGAYIDQNVSTNSTGIVKVGNASPMVGLFGVWNETLDGTGTELKVSAGYGQKNTTMNRQVVDGSEAGSGSSTLNTQGVQAIAKYGFAVAEKTIVSPYAGLRYTQNNMGGYTEGSSATVTAPLTYSAVNTNATTLVAGLGANYKVIPDVTLLASAGLENDLNTSNGNYTATGLYGLNSINFNPNPVRTRATGSLGAYYDLAKNQRLGIYGIYRQEPYQGVSTTSVMATYTVGL